MKPYYLLLICAVLLNVSCRDFNDELAIEELAVGYQKAYLEFEYDAIEPFLTKDAKVYAKKMFELYPVSSDKKKELTEKFKGKDNKVITTEINGKEAEVIMCCNIHGDNFTTFWKQEQGKWKLDFERTFVFNSKKYN